MNEQGLWKLFLVTGSPQVWLAIRGTQGEQKEEERTVPAFRGTGPKQI